MTTKADLRAAVVNARQEIAAARLRLQSILVGCEEPELADLADSIDQEVIGDLLTADDSLAGALRRLEA